MRRMQVNGIEHSAQKLLIIAIIFQRASEGTREE
jgi:hypothetical protein